MHEKMHLDLKHSTAPITAVGGAKAKGKASAKAPADPRTYVGKAVTKFYSECVDPATSLPQLWTGMVDKYHAKEPKDLKFEVVFPSQYGVTDPNQLRDSWTLADVVNGVALHRAQQEKGRLDKEETG